MLDVELLLLSRTDLHSDDKWYVEKYKIYMNLIWLSGEVGTGAGDVAGGAEFRPTDASMATLAELERDLAAARLAYQKLLETDISHHELIRSQTPNRSASQVSDTYLPARFVTRAVA